MNTELTILLPCLNEEKTLGICITKAKDFLERYRITGEILIADNGSTDNSASIAEHLGARVIHVSEKGYGAALLAGITAAKGKYVIMGDADDSYDFSALDRYVDALRQGFHLVMGNRFKGGIAPGAMPFLHKYLGNPVLSWLGRIFYKIPVRDFHCGLRAFDAEAMRGIGLRIQGMEFASEMVVKSALNGLTITEVPTKLAKDGRDRKPHLRTFRDGWRHLCFLLALTPKWLFFYPGLFLTLLGLLLIALLAGSPRMLGGVMLDGKTFIFGCMSLLIGLQSITFGLILRAYSGRIGVIPFSPRSDKLLVFLTRDKLAATSGILFFLGTATFLYCLLSWVDAGFGELGGRRFHVMAILAFTCYASSFQFFQAAFVHEIISLHLANKKTTHNDILYKETL